ncbi:MAG: hypothetical protein ACFFDF_18980 [Candidatus Odinarchaeota archaeon]
MSIDTFDLQYLGILFALDPSVAPFTKEDAKVLAYIPTIYGWILLFYLVEIFP